MYFYEDHLSRMVSSSWPTSRCAGVQCAVLGRAFHAARHWAAAGRAAEGAESRALNDVRAWSDARSVRRLRRIGHVRTRRARLVRRRLGHRRRSFTAHRRRRRLWRHHSSLCLYCCCSRWWWWWWCHWRHVFSLLLLLLQLLTGCINNTDTYQTLHEP